MSSIRAPSDAAYLWLSKDAHDRALEAAGTKGLAVYVALCRLESNAPVAHKGAFSASRFNIAQFSGVSVRTVADLLPVLVRARLITFQSGRSTKTDRGHEANKYTLLPIGFQQGIIAQLPYANSAGDNCLKRKNFLPTGIKKGRSDKKASGKTPRIGVAFSSYPKTKQESKIPTL